MLRGKPNFFFHHSKLFHTMKNILFSAIALLMFCFQVNAQTAVGAIWTGSRSATGEAKAVHAAIAQGYDAFIAGDLEKGFAIYTDDAVEIDPGGNMTIGKKAMQEGWEAFSKMADEAPKFSYSNVQVRLLTADVALAVWDSEADIKIGGQQVGGKTKGSAVLRKIKGEWKLEFDQLTPIMPMPGAGN
jgi:uncharacterized protein (TIGR02246 family)